MPENQLKRSLNSPLLTLYGLGTILGAGIYVLIGKVAGVAGIYAPIAFIVSAIVAAFTGLSYAQLSVRYPLSAGEALYVNKAFSIAPLSTLVGWFVIATGVVSTATLINGFIGYLHVFIDIPSALAITLTILIIALIACWGITESVTIAAIITALEIAGLIVVLGTLNDEFSQLPQRWPELVPPLKADIWTGILLGAFLAFYAFIGFEDMVNVAEEVIDPKRTMPLAIITALAVASLFYVLVAIIAVLAMPAEQLATSDSPMVSLLQQENQGLATAVGIISLIAIINGALVQIIMGARMLYGMGCQKLIWGLFTQVSTKTRTPVVATMTIALIVWVLALGFPLVTLAKATSFIIIIVFTLVNLSLVAIKLRELGRTDGFYRYTAIITPVISSFLCLGLLMAQLFL